MNIFRSLVLLLAALFFHTEIQAQITKDPTTWTFEAKKMSGNKYRVVLHLSLKEGWHIWSLKPGGDGLQVAPEIKLDKNPSVKTEGAVRESGKKITGPMDGVDGIVSHFERNVTYEQIVTISANTKLTGSYMYQVCDDHMCLPPRTKQFSIDVTDAGPATTAAATDTLPQTAVPVAAAVDTMTSAPVTPAATVIPAVKDTADSNTPSDASAGAPALNLWVLFFAAFGFGLLAITTPCVYSMIPITVSFFTKRSKTRKEGIRNAIYYSLSIIIIFTLLGVLISLAFGPQALYKLSTNWIANLFFFAVFIIFGISFLGAFEITLPSSWTNKTDTRANTQSFKGIFFMALTLVIVSFSCTSGFIGPLLVGASRGGLLGPAIGMLGFSVGLALPFTFFSLAPALINKLGNAGGWLNQVKVTLGFIEIGLALKFFSNADLVNHWRILDREIFIAIWIVLSIMLGIYLLGKLKLSHDDATAKNVYGQEYVSLFKLFLAMGFFSFAVYLLPGMWGAPLKGLGQFLPPMATQDFIIGKSSNEHTATAVVDPSVARPVKYVAEMRIYEPDVVKSNGLVTFYDYEEALAAAKAQKKPLMVDFTGITCVNCRLMETNVWANPEVMNRMKNDFVVVSLYCDASQVPIPKAEQYYSKATESDVKTLGDKNLDLQISKFNSNSQPFYFFVDEHGNSLTDAGYGTNTNAAKFVQHLDAVKAKYKALHP